MDIRKPTKSGEAVCITPTDAGIINRLNETIKSLRHSIEERDKRITSLAKELAETALDGSKYQFSRAAIGVPTIAEKLLYARVASRPAPDTDVLAHPIVLAILRAVGGAITLSSVELNNAMDPRNRIEYLEQVDPYCMIIREVTDDPSTDRDSGPS
jgi:hypothetical protein